MKTSEQMESLVEEYRSLLRACDDKTPKSIQKKLANQAEWTPQAAEHLLSLAQNYGSFMLSNALALSLALNVEDGELGF